MTHDGPVENWLAIIGVVSLIYWGWRIFAAFQSRGRGKPSAPVVSTPAAAAAEGAVPAVAATPLESDIVVIAAAVYAVLGAHRIVHLEPESPGQGWAVEGRWMQQTSHTTRP